MNNIAVQSQDSYLSEALNVRLLRESDYPDIKDIQDSVYFHLNGAWPLKKIRTQLMTFEQGQWVAVAQGQVVGAAFSLRLDSRNIPHQHTYSEITSNGYLVNHDSKGDVLYGIECVVHPDWRRRGVGKALYRAREQWCQENGIERIVFGGRLPGYHKVFPFIEPEQYIWHVQAGRLLDPVLSFQLSQGFVYRWIMQKYQPYDEASKTHAAFLEKMIV